MAEATNIYDTPYQSWGDDLAKTVTFIVTEDCQLRCQYCYLVGKNKRNKMDFEIARKTIEYILQENSFFNDEAIIWEFIGGEPFLESKPVKTAHGGNDARY